MWCLLCSSWDTVCAQTVQLLGLSWRPSCLTMLLWGFRSSLASGIALERPWLTAAAQPVR